MVRASAGACCQHVLGREERRPLTRLLYADAQRLHLCGSVC